MDFEIPVSLVRLSNFEQQGMAAAFPSICPDRSTSSAQATCANPFCPAKTAPRPSVTAAAAAVASNVFPPSSTFQSLLSEIPFLANKIRSVEETVYDLEDAALIRRIRSPRSSLTFTEQSNDLAWCAQIQKAEFELASAQEAFRQFQLEREEYHRRASEVLRTDGIVDEGDMERSMELRMGRGEHRDSGVSLSKIPAPVETRFTPRRVKNEGGMFSTRVTSSESVASRTGAEAGLMTSAARVAVLGWPGDLVRSRGLKYEESKDVTHQTTEVPRPAMQSGGTDEGRQLSSADQAAVIEDVDLDESIFDDGQLDANVPSGMPLERSSHEPDSAERDGNCMDDESGRRLGRAPSSSSVYSGSFTGSLMTPRQDESLQPSPRNGLQQGKLTYPSRDSMLLFAEHELQHGNNSYESHGTRLERIPSLPSRRSSEPAVVDTQRALGIPDAVPSAGGIKVGQRHWGTTSLESSGPKMRNSRNEDTVQAKEDQRVEKKIHWYKKVFRRAKD